MVPRNPSGCQECRDKHVGCDKAEPVCGRCSLSGRPCTRELLFRSHNKKFKPNHDWVTLNSVKEYQWINESGNHMEDTCDTASEDEEEDPVSLSPDNTPIHRNQAPMPSPIPPLAIGPLPPSAISPHQREFSHSPWRANFSGTPETLHNIPTYGPVEPPVEPHVFSHVIHNVYLQTNSSPPGELSRVETNQPPPLRSNDSVWPLTDATEARLFGHYILDLARWLDLCDPSQHFQVEVPKRAATCPALLKAILALSARQLFLTNRASESNEITARMYYDQCIELLIPMVKDAINRADETLFAALIILRVLEEIDLLETGHQDTKHIKGIQSFIREHGANVMQGGLGEAAFWVGLRQEIYVATIYHRAILIEIGHIDRTNDPVTDFAWANRAVVHLADVLNCCFQSEGIDRAHWSRLKEESDRWQQSRPDSFTPYYSRAANREKGEAFPEILHIHPCHIIGIQHHKLGQILLSTCDPKRPRIGKDRAEAEQVMLSEIQNNLRELCGIGLHNRTTPPGMFTACMGISLCGDRFEDPMERQALLDLLIETQRDHARPTDAIQKQMKINWGWKDDDAA